MQYKNSNIYIFNLTFYYKFYIINIENEEPQTWFASYMLKNTLNLQVTDVFFYWLSTFANNYN